MPELKHEVPSQDEIRGYLQEHFAQSGFAPFGLTPQELSHWFSPDVALAFTSLRRMYGESIALRAFDELFAGLNRMNRLPREHPFWRNSNYRPTIYKLSDFCRMRLVEDPSDIGELWVAAILPVWFGQNDFGQKAWLALSRLPGFEACWPIHAALTLHLTANSTEEQFTDFVREADAERESLPILKQIAAESEGLAATWATQVLQLMDQPQSTPIDSDS